MPASLFEHELIQKCCDGDRTAYRELYNHYSGELLAIAMRYMKSKQEAEDVLQEAYIKVFKNLASFDQRASLKTWLTRIVINTALNMLRKEHKIVNWDISEVADVKTNGLPLHDFQFNELLSFIQQLPAGCKAVFNLYAIEGYTHKEIGEMLKVSEGTSKSQYFRAKRLLQEIIFSEENRTKLKMI
jgi:RNA polymerase sigma factor (sigma-70 family)